MRTHPKHERPERGHLSLSSDGFGPVGTERLELGSSEDCTETKVQSKLLCQTEPNGPRRVLVTRREQQLFGLCCLHLLQPNRALPSKKLFQNELAVSKHLRNHRTVQKAQTIVRALQGLPFQPLWILRVRVRSTNLRKLENKVRFQTVLLLRRTSGSCIERGRLLSKRFK